MINLEDNNNPPSSPFGVDGREKRVPSSAVSLVPIPPTDVDSNDNNDGSSESLVGDNLYQASSLFAADIMTSSECKDDEGLLSNRHQNNQQMISSNEICEYTNNEVFIQIIYKKISDIDLMRQTFTTDFELTASWKDKEKSNWQNNGHFIENIVKLEEKNRISDITKNLFGKNFEPDETPCIVQIKDELYRYDQSGDFLKKTQLFSPKLQLTNLIRYESADGLVDEQWFRILNLKNKDQHEKLKNCEEHDIRVSYTMKGTGTFQLKFDLHSFPFDSQLLTIELTSELQCPVDDTKKPSEGDKKKGESIYEKHRVKLSQNTLHDKRSLARTDKFSLYQQYQLHDSIRFIEEISSKKYSPTRSQYSILKVSAVVVRKCSNWILNVVLPLFCIVASTFVIFVLEPSDIGTRATIVITSLLTTVAFKFVVSSQMPTISYLSLIDWYIVCTILAEFFMMAYVAAVGIEAVNNSGSPEFSRTTAEGFWLACVIWIVLHLVSWLYCYLFIYIPQSNVLNKQHVHVWVEGFKSFKYNDSNDLRNDYEAIETWLKKHKFEDFLLIRDLHGSSNFNKHNIEFQTLKIRQYSKDKKVENRAAIDYFDTIKTKVISDCSWKEYMLQQHRSHRFPILYWIWHIVWERPDVSSKLKQLDIDDGHIKCAIQMDDEHILRKRMAVAKNEVTGHSPRLLLGGLKELKFKEVDRYHIVSFSTDYEAELWSRMMGFFFDLVWDSKITYDKLKSDMRDSNITESSEIKNSNVSKCLKMFQNSNVSKCLKMFQNSNESTSTFILRSSEDSSVEDNDLLKSLKVLLQNLKCIDILQTDNIIRAKFEVLTSNYKYLAYYDKSLLNIEVEQ